MKPSLDHVNLGELISDLRKISSDAAVRRLIELLEGWRTDSRTTDELHQSVERYIGNSWIVSDQEHNTVYRLWAAFRDGCISGRMGMTINERLFCFDLFDAWDNAKTEADRAVIRQKIDFDCPSLQRSAARDPNGGSAEL